ncbi:hypothetical protein QQ008_07920 [Fulvivirgaceae bacterium BMA10]|uniref:Uncharacterized protein n=1 Tax=Splendidivirga corallicola TaxID=3051826 RepID=A0ABT8KLH1_9BACT|nr:hypothetical protein [Fulvivirgaceae bacterium BMA10]
MPSRKKSVAQLIEQSRLILDESGIDNPNVTIGTGSNIVLSVEQRKAARFYTYDTGSIEYIYFELAPEQIAEGDSWLLTSWVNAFYIKGSMKLLYISNSAHGQVKLSRHLRKPLFRKSYHEYRGNLDLEFSDPLLNLGQQEKIRIQWPFITKH